MEISGHLKFFNFRRGYGFLERRGEEDVLVHAVALRAANLWPDDLWPGAPLTVVAVRTPLGLRAVRVLAPERRS